MINSFEVLPLEAIALPLDDINQAIQLSSQVASETRQWQTYLNALALFGFKQWLNERAAEITVNQESCSILHPAYANVIDAVCNLIVGEFKICLLTTGTLTDVLVNLSKLVIDIPEYTAHFYVLIEVEEEQEQVIIKGFLRYDQLLSLRSAANLQADADWNYQLPMSWFDHHSDRLLLYLRCLENNAIALPPIPPKRLADLSNIQDELTTKLPQLQSPDIPLSQILTWDMATVLLTNRDLLNWLYRLQTQPPSQSNNIQLLELLQRLNQQIVNVGLWLQDTIDEFSQNLSWVLLPAFAPATVGLRSLSVSSEIEAIITELRNTGAEIPPDARGAYQNFQLAETPLRLYAITWEQISNANIPEWALLLLLGAQPNTEPPYGIKLQVSDKTNVLVEQILEEDAYLYTQMFGTRDETFVVTITLITGETLRLPPFGFHA